MMGAMHPQFDEKAEDAKIASLYEKEEEELTKILSEKYHYEYTDLTIIAIHVDALRLIPEKDARASEVVAFEKAGKHLSIGIKNPQAPGLKEIESALESRGFILKRHLISKRSLDAALERYEELSFASQSKAGTFDIEASDLSNSGFALNSLSSLRAFLEKMTGERQAGTISLMLEGILSAGLTLKASDIHVEPEEEGVRLRLRLDGQLTDVFMLDAHAYKFLNSRIKLLSGLKLNIGNRAQDGRFSITVDGAEVEVRTSIIPGNYGESIVLRILDPRAIERTYEQMGIHPHLFKRLSTEIRRPNGMLLTTGPTGSGKTTTLYAFLKEIHEPEIKIVTIEDPIEYHLTGIVQTQVNHKDYTFASGLRSVLRQDPDIIMVGEIRDAEVAETAIQAALTGHFVFSTLHTNNAAGAFPRLIDLGIDPKTIPSAVTVAMAQRLVRTLDPEARKKRAATEEEKALMQKVFETCTNPELVPTSFEEVWEPAPRTPEETGFKGRLGVHEAIFMDEELAELLRTNPPASEIEKSTRRQGYLTMAQDGVIKALEGRFSLDELFKVVDMPR